MLVPGVPDPQPHGPCKHPVSAFSIIKGSDRPHFRGSCVHWPRRVIRTGISELYSVSYIFLYSSIRASILAVPGRWSPIPTNTHQCLPIPHQYPLKTVTNTLPIPPEKEHCIITPPVPPTKIYPLCKQCAIGFGHQVPGIGHQAPGTRTGHLAPGTMHRASGNGHRAPGAGHQVPEQ